MHIILPVLSGVHLAVFCDCPLAVAIAILMGSAWKNAMGPINRCVTFIDMAKRSMTAQKVILSGRAVTALEGVLSGPHGDS